MGMQFQCIEFLVTNLKSLSDRSLMNPSDQMLRVATKDSKTKYVSIRSRSPHRGQNDSRYSYNRALFT